MMGRKRALVGAGGFAKDVKALIGVRDIPCFVEDDYYNAEKGTLKLSNFNPGEYELLITIADPQARARIAASLPKETVYWSVVHPSAHLLMPDNIYWGVGCVISAMCILVDYIHIGDHCHLNLGTILGHDVAVGNFFTAAPGAGVMGNNVIGDRVYMGTNACTKEKINICDDVIIGLNTGVVKDITEPGVYVGTPARRIK